jgi:hypothetical protein
MLYSVSRISFEDFCFICFICVLATIHSTIHPFIRLSILLPIKRSLPFDSKFNIQIRIRIRIRMRIRKHEYEYEYEYECEYENTNPTQYNTITITARSIDSRCHRQRSVPGGIRNGLHLGGLHGRRRGRPTARHSAGTHDAAGFSHDAAPTKSRKTRQVTVGQALPRNLV